MTLARRGPGKEAEKVLDYLQSIKKLELKSIPFLKKGANPPNKSK